MVPIREISVDLGVPIEKRWSSLASLRPQALELMEYYRRDLGSVDESAFTNIQLTESQQRELQGLADTLGVSRQDVQISNLYYDLLKTLIGCTAFALETSEGIFHARNLDWWSDGTLLTRQTCVFRYLEGGELRSKVVGWPGFLGAFSGVAPGRFAVSLNAVTSSETPTPGSSVTFLIRDVLNEEPCFQSAVKRLRDTPLSGDCLLLITGTKPGERVVIERTPSRAVLRYPSESSGSLVVANSYSSLVEQEAPVASSLLASTSCGRTKRTEQLLKQSKPRSASQCFDILTDPQVQMEITAQSMVFQARTGQLSLKLPTKR